MDCADGTICTPAGLTPEIQVQAETSSTVTAGSSANYSSRLGLGASRSIATLYMLVLLVVIWIGV